MDELHEWEANPLFLNSERPFNKVGETDIIFRPKITPPAGVVEYHTGRATIMY